MASNSRTSPANIKIAFQPCSEVAKLFAALMKRSAVCLSKGTRSWFMDLASTYVQGSHESLSKLYRQPVHAIREPVENHGHRHFSGAGAVGIFTAREEQVNAVQVHGDNTTAGAPNSISHLKGAIQHL